MNTKAQHTPGPWELIGPTGDRKRIRVRNDHDGWCSLRVDVDSDDCDYDTAEANARLIAAAPELLFALSQIVSELPAKRDWLSPDIERIAKEALKKATA